MGEEVSLGTCPVALPPSTKVEQDGSPAALEGAENVSLPLSNTDKPEEVEARQALVVSRANIQQNMPHHATTRSALLSGLGGAKSRVQNSSKWCYIDYDYVTRSSRISHDDNPDTLLIFQTIPVSAITRFVIVEDLDPGKLSFLSSAFKIPQGFFASHHGRSGIRSNEESSHVERDAWTRSRPVKNQFTLSWLRSVLLTVPLSPHVRDKLVSGPDAPQLHCISSDCPKGSKHKARIIRNVFRQPVNLSSKHKGHSSTKIPVGWEERLSIWKGRVEHHDVCE